MSKSVSIFLVAGILLLLAGGLSLFYGKTIGLYRVIGVIIESWGSVEKIKIKKSGVYLV